MKKKHLPEMPSAVLVEKEGINLGQMDAKLLKKIEELTLHLIDQDKKITAQEAKINSQNQMIKKLSDRLNAMPTGR